MATGAGLSLSCLLSLRTGRSAVLEVGRPQSLYAACLATSRSATVGAPGTGASKAIWSSKSSSCLAAGQWIQFDDAAGRLGLRGAKDLLAGTRLAFFRYHC